jgi:hypothetical protein
MPPLPPIPDVFASAALAAGGAVVLAGIVWGLFWSQSVRRLGDRQEAARAKALADIQETIDASRRRDQRRSEAVLQLASDLWRHLADLDSAADILWDDPSREHLDTFLAVLTSARVSSNRGRLILPEGLYSRLEAVFNLFEGIEVGTVRLTDLRSEDRFDEFSKGSKGVTSLQEQLRKHNQTKRQYEALADEVLRDLREQLDLPTERSNAGNVVPHRRTTEIA